MAMSIEEKRAKRRAYYWANKEKEAAQCKSYRERNREALNAYNRQYHQNNKETISKRMKEYNKTNKEKISIRGKKYRELNKEKVRELDRKHKKRKKDTDPVFKFKCRLRGAINLAFKSKDLTKSKASNDILGIDVKSGWEYLKYTWLKNYKTVWNGQPYHLDHIIPISTAKTVEDVIKLNHYTNLQMLTPEDNIAKSNKF